MPRSSGTYSLPANAEAVNGTTINPTYFNNTINDIADELTNSVAADGQTTMTGPLKVVAGSITDAAVQRATDSNTGVYFPATDTVAFVAGGTKIVEATTTGATVTGTATVTGKVTGAAFDVNAVTFFASATTLDLGAFATSVIDLSNSASITSFGTANAGVMRHVRVSSNPAPTLVNSSNLICPGFTNIVCAQFDFFTALSYGAGTWQIVHYQRFATSP
jgi:hypothetical protein